MKKSIEHILSSALDGKEIYIYERILASTRPKDLEYLLQEPDRFWDSNGVEAKVTKTSGVVKKVVCHTETWESDSIIITLDVDGKEVTIKTYSLTEIIEFKTRKRGKQH